MINLFTSYYIDKHPARQKEFDECLRKNIDLNEINMIYVLTEQGVDAEILKNKKVINVVLKSRPTYNTFFEVIRMFSGDEDWNIIANSDIHFDSTITMVEQYKRSYKPVCFALTRWEVERDKTFFLNRPDSQDAWIFKGKPLNVKGDFYMGTCGCDNAIADRLHNAGYHVINPSKTIKTYHLHQSGVRRYNTEYKVPQPYKLLNPTA